MTLPPLSPAQGGRSIDIAALGAADIIVSTTNAAISKAIRAATGSQVSHAMIYAGNGVVIEAVAEGVVERPLTQALNGAVLAVAYRLERLNPGQANMVVNFARAQNRRKYDVGGIVGQAGYQLDRWFLCDVQNVRDCEETAARNNLWLQSAAKFFCSELVAAAYQQAGVPLFNRPPERISPEDVAQVAVHGKLLYVGHLKA